MAIKCEICEGALVMDENGAGATCTVCGMKYSIQRVRQMASGKTAQPVKAEPKKAETPKTEAPKVEPKEVEPVQDDVVYAGWTEVEGGVVQNNPGAVQGEKKITKDWIISAVLCFLGMGLVGGGGFFPMFIGTVLCIIAVIRFLNKLSKKG